MIDRTRGALFGLLSAALFGASAPLAKLLLPGVEPLMLSGILYLGAALALGAWQLARAGGPVRAEAHLGRRDLIPLAFVVLLGGVAGPLLLLHGLSRVSGISGSLLLNLESVFTALIAVTFFREHLSRREIAGFALVLAGSAVVSGSADPSRAEFVGALFIAAACLSWAIDNNLSQRLSLRDPVELASAKTGFAGATSLVIALLLHQRIPSGSIIVAGGAVGALGYGASIVLAMLSLRHLGAARQSAFFATAPFAGAVLAIPLFHRNPSALELAGGAAMICGATIVLRARHSHRHRHEALEHEHMHVHDEHHRHSHEGPAGAEPHSHVHRHEPMEHEHPHASDAHHRHFHDERS